MSDNRYSIEYGEGTPRQDYDPAFLPVPMYQPQPPVAPPAPKPRMSAGMGMIGGVLLSAAALFGAETLTPFAYKPSTVMGDYHGNMAAQTRAQELEVQAMYDEWVQKAQISVIQQQEDFRTQLNAVLANYQAAYDRARIFSDATAKMQQDYMHQVMVQKREQQTGSSSVINLAQVLADVLRPFSPELSDQFDTYADDTAARLRAKLDDAVQNGVTIEVEGWDTNLPSPETVRAELGKVKPIIIPSPPRIHRMAHERGEEE